MRQGLAGWSIFELSCFSDCHVCGQSIRVRATSFSGASQCLLQSMARGS
jgi:hypothetical protein